MNRPFLYPFILFLLVSAVGMAQIRDDQRENQMEQIIESIGESDETNLENSSLLEDMTSNAENPININLANEEELTNLNALDFRQIQNIINYRKKYGHLVSSGELSAIEGFTPELVSSIAPFITFELPADSLSGSRKAFKSSLITRIKSTFPEAKGYRSSAQGKGAVYPGFPISLYTRYHLEIPRKVEFGLITDNDAGEQFFKGSNQLGFDYYSAFISLKGKGVLRRVILGDFLIRIGQGLSFGGGSILGKSANTMGILKFGQTARGYTSSDENRFFRGASAIMGSGPFQLVIFYSNKNRDANILTDKLSGARYFTSLQTSGYHRTLSEIEDEKSLNEQMAGGYGELRTNRLRIGGLFVFQRFALPMSTGSSPYKAKSFSGCDNLNLGLDYQLALPHIQYFGEAGLSKNGKPGGVQGMVWHAHPQLSLSAYFRYFDPGFNTFYGSSLSESSGNRNETGLYTGVMAFPFPKMKIFGYVDIYHFPWLTYSTMAPTSGSDYLVQIDLTLSRKISLSLKGKFETKPQKATVSKGVAIDLDEKTTKIRIQPQFRLSEKLTLRTRFEYAGYSFNNLSEKGFLVFQDLIIAPFQKLKIWLRYAWFNTESYNSRIYSYENDLLYSFAIPEFHGNGHRFYINLKWSPSSAISIYLKGGCTFHNGVNSWGSGNDITSGNLRTELRGLVNWRF